MAMQATLFDTISEINVHTKSKLPQNIVNFDLFETLYEDEKYLTEQIITYIGNKRSLLQFITKGIQIVQKRLNKNKLSIFDVFSGSGIVARHFK
ncbi:MAG: DNA adenine methylase, partial [Treponema sp.]|nr:DNA adenine methylase [Treponema sp.]